MKANLALYKLSADDVTQPISHGDNILLVNDTDDDQRSTGG